MSQRYFLRVALTDEGRAAVMDEAKRQRIPAAELVRQCVAKQLNRDEIADVPPVGYGGHRDKDQSGK